MNGSDTDVSGSVTGWNWRGLVSSKELLSPPESTGGRPLARVLSCGRENRGSPSLAGITNGYATSSDALIVKEGYAKNLLLDYSLIIGDKKKKRSSQ